jgi:hypothetical protein
MTQPVGRIEAVVKRVSGGIASDPPSVVFGTVAVGTVIRQRIGIWDAAVPPRMVERVI